MLDANDRKSIESVRALTRGLKLVEAFAATNGAGSLSDLARAADLNRATARRLLLTLQDAGYVTSDGKLFSLSPRILTLAYPYLSSFAHNDMVMPFMEELLRGSTSVASTAAVLDGTDLIYFATMPANSYFRTWNTVGTRIPAFAASMGRALLSRLPPDVADDILDRTELRAITPYTTTDRDTLRSMIAEARDMGFAICNRELDIEVRSCAVPILKRNGDSWAAICATCLDPQRPLDDFLTEFVPKLMATANKISSNLR